MNTIYHRSGDFCVVKFSYFYYCVCKKFLWSTHIFLMVNRFYACSLVQLRLWILRNMKSETVRRACCCIHGYHATVGMYERGPGHAVVMWCGRWETVKIFLQWDFQIYGIACATVDWKQEIFLLWSNVLLLPACIQLSSLHGELNSSPTQVFEWRLWIPH